MSIAHICNVDCKLEVSPEGNKAHVMYSAEPNSAAGRYQWEQNQRLYRMGKGARKAWRESGQGSSRNVRVWDEWRRGTDSWKNYGWIGGGRASARRWAEVEEWLISA